MGGTGGSPAGVDHAGAIGAVRNALAPVLPHAATVVLAVSGGRDSVGMALLVAGARPDLRMSVVHVRHGLRDDAADAAAARACAAALRIRAEVIAVEVVADGTGPENAARDARYAALAAAAARAGAGYVLTGHTAEDQAETVLLNLARGAGLGGLAGIPPLRRLAEDLLVVRPVLGLRRAAVRAVAEASGVPVVEDPTNADPQQRRSVARHELLPLLSRLTGGGTDAVDALARLASHARSDAAALDTIATDLATRLVRRWGDVLTLPVDALSELPVAVASRVVRYAADQAGSPAPSEAAVRAVLALSDGHATTLTGGLVASRGGGLLAFAPTAAEPPERAVRDAAVALPEIGLVLRCDRSEAGGVLPPWAPARAATMVPVAGLDGLVVRARRPGDRIKTAAGTQRVAAAMMSAGVPRIARSRVPVVADDQGVLWVPGVAVRAGAAGPWRLRFEFAAGK